MLQCGMAELDITPPLGSSIPGYTNERKSSGILNPLYAKALVVDTGETALAIIAVDALYIPARETERIRDKLERVTGMSRVQVMVSATHSHTGAPVRQGLDGSLHEEYLFYMSERAADAAILAYSNRQPAKIGWGCGTLNGMSFNRRFWMKDGSLRTNPGRLNPNIDRPAGPIDPDVAVVRVDALDGSPIGVVTNFACHTDTVGGAAYSGDFPAYLSRELKKSLGEGAVSLFLLGACGDINHADVSRTGSEQGSMTEPIGVRLAEVALQVREQIATTESADAAAVRTTVTMRLREATAAEQEHARQALEQEGVSDVERFFAEQVLKVAALPGGEAELEVQAMRIGSLAIVGLPGEIFVELGLTVKRESPFSQTIVNTLCNGSIYGYVGTKEAYVQGGYEPKLKVFNRISPGTGERLAEAGGKLLSELAAAPTRG